MAAIGLIERIERHIEEIEDFNIFIQMRRQAVLIGQGDIRLKSFLDILTRLSWKYEDRVSEIRSILMKLKLSQD